MFRLALLPCLLVLILVSCDASKDDPLNVESIYGTWRLVEYLVDPGDGSGQFSPTDSGEELSLYQNNTFRTNWNPCGYSGEEEDPIQGDFQLLVPQRFEILCESGSRIPPTGYLENGFLIVSHGGCIEACLYKFLKISDR